MKKLLILISLCLTLVLCLNIDLQWNKIEDGKLTLTMNNIEALADGENQGVECKLSGSLDCPSSIIKVKYIL